DPRVVFDPTSGGDDIGTVLPSKWLVVIRREDRDGTAGRALRGRREGRREAPPVLLRALRLGDRRKQRVPLRDDHAGRQPRTRRRRHRRGRGPGPRGLRGPRDVLRRGAGRRGRAAEGREPRRQARHGPRGHHGPGRPGPVHGSRGATGRSRPGGVAGSTLRVCPLGATRSSSYRPGTRKRAFRPYWTSSGAGSRRPTSSSSTTG